MKKTILFLLSVLAVAYARAESMVVDGVTWYYSTYQRWNSSSQTYTTCAQITSGTDKYAGKMKIPSKINGYMVTRIRHYAFQSCSGLTDITIPNTVEEIYDYAFSGCTSLTRVIVPDSVAHLGSYCFEKCSALKAVKLSSKLTALPSECFIGCSSLTSIGLPEELTTIEAKAFYGCTSLANITLPEGLMSIGRSAFQSCKSFTRLDIPSTVESIGSRMIHGCDKLKTITIAAGNANYKVINNCLVSKNGSTLLAVPFGCEEVDIPVGVITIPEYLFDNDDNLVRVTIPAGVTLIGSSAFWGCDRLQKVEIPMGCTTIESSAFYDCDALTQVSFPEGLTTIGSQAFEFCRLREVILPASVASLGYYVFYGGNYTTRQVMFLGAPPSGVADSYLLSSKNVSYPRKYGAQWLEILNGVNKFNGYNQLGKPKVEYVSVTMRANDPTILDCVYKVNSTKPTVKVRALAFQDGERSFAKVIRPETFVADTNGVQTAGNIGDAIVPNVPHRLSWRVSSDWSNRLAKVSFEVLATEGELLPLEVRTIPASDAYGKMEVTWNALTESQWFDALLWLYADKNAKISVSNGNCYYNGKLVASRTTCGNSYAAPAVVFAEMGYTLITGEVQNYVNEETRLGLSPSGYRQYGYKIINEK